MARHVWTTRTMIAVTLVGAVAAAGRDCSECHKLHLTGNDFAEWRSDTGDWQNAGDAQLNPENEKLLMTRSGSGALVNGPTGKTVNLFSQREFGDLRAHVEFVMAKDSNSGVYFQGRYEVQIYDSWQKASEYPGIECAGIYQRWDEKRTRRAMKGIRPASTSRGRRASGRRWTWSFGPRVSTRPAARSPMLASRRSCIMAFSSTAMSS